MSNKNTLVSHVLPVVILLVFPRHSSLLKEVFVVKQSEKEVSSLQQKEDVKSWKNYLVLRIFSSICDGIDNLLHS